MIATERRVQCRARVLTLLALVVTTVLVGCGGLFFRRNANLTRVPDTSPLSAYSPVYSRDGMYLYFLVGVQHGPEHPDSFTVQVRRIRIDGTDERLIRDGSYGDLCVSPDGSRLLVISQTITPSGIETTPLLLDTAGRILDTIAPRRTSVVTARFNTSGDRVYYFDRYSGFFRWDLAARREDTVLRNLHFKTEEDFDVWGDSLLAFSGKVYDMVLGTLDTTLPLVKPRFRPSDPGVVLGALPKISGISDELVAVDRRTGHMTHFDAKPYWSCDISIANWSPDAVHIVMSASEVPQGDDNTPYGYEIWILSM